MENRATERESKLIKLIKSKRRSGRRDRYHKHPQECVADQHTDGDKNMIRFEAVFESQKSVIQRSIQRDLE